MRFVLHKVQAKLCCSSQWMGTIGPCHYFSLRSEFSTTTANKYTNKRCSCFCVTFWPPQQCVFVI